MVMDHFLLISDIKKIDFRTTTGHDLLVKLPAPKGGVSRLTVVLRAGEQAEQRQKQVCGSNLVM